MNHASRRAFTVVELLVCIALLALVAAIAVPNYSEVQTNSDIVSAKADMQSLKTGLEVYKVDLGAYPWMNNFHSALCPSNGSISALPTLERLTTPVSYLNGATPFYDPFEGNKYWSGSALSQLNTPSESLADETKQYFYHARNLRDTSTWMQVSSQDTDPVWYFLESAGPDKAHHHMWQILNGMTTDTLSTRAMLGTAIYNPTNGSISRGSIWEVGGQPEGRGVSFAHVINAANSSTVSDWKNYAPRQFQGIGK